MSQIFVSLNAISLILNYWHNIMSHDKINIILIMFREIVKTLLTELKAQRKNLPYKKKS